MYRLIRVLRKNSSEGWQKFKKRNVSSAEKVKVTTLFDDSEISANYAQERHSYSDEMFKFISDYCKETTPDLNFALDVGSGPGNSTLGLTKYFKKVLGVDVSKKLIAQAPKNIPNCEFQVSNATNLPFVDNASVDLFACGMAFHLLPHAEVFAEAERVLRPGGSLAIYGYGRPCSNDPDLEATLELMFGTALKHSKELKYVLDLYPDLQLPYPGWKRNNDYVVSHPIKKDGIKGLARLLYRFMLASGHNDTEFVQNMDKELANVFEKRGWNSQHQEFEMKYNTTILLAHKPN